MTRRTVAAGLLFAAAALAGTLVTGCQSGVSAGPPGPPANAVAPPLESETTSPSATPASPVTPPAARRCDATSLKLGLGPANGAAGHVYQALEFTNQSSSRCTMAGFPGVSYVTGDNGRQIGAAAIRDGQAGSLVNLAPGQVAHATVDFVDVGVFDQHSCQPVPVAGLRIYPPNDTASMYIARAGMGCAGNPPNSQLRVQPIKAGPGDA